MPNDHTRARNRGKSFERRLAKEYDGKRNPGNHGGAADVDGGGAHAWRTIEAKNLANLPVTIVRWLEQAEKGAAVRLRATGRVTLPMVIIKKKGQHTPNALVVMRLRDFDEWCDGDAASAAMALLGRDEVDAGDD